MLVTNNAEGGTNGVAVSTGNSGGGSGTAWNTVTPDSQTIEYSSSQVAHGNLSYHFALAAAGGPYVYWDTGSLPASNKTLYTRIYIYHQTSPATTGRFLQYSNSSFALIAGVGIDSSDRLIVRNAANTVILTSTTVIPTGAWFAVEFYTFSSATVGEVELKIYLDPDSGTPTEVLTSSSTQNTRGDNIYAAIFGLPTAVSSANFYMDNLAAQDTGYVGMVAPPAPAVSTTYRNTAEGQSSGTTVTTANSGGGSGDAFDVIDVTGTIAHTFSTSYGMHGTQSYAIAPTGSASIIFVYENQNDTTGAQQAYFYFTAYPSATCAFMGTYSTDTKSTMAITSSGAVTIYDDAGSVTSSAGGVVPLNRWVRFDMITTIGATTSTGRIQAKVSLEDNTDTLFSYDSGATVNVGTVAIESSLYGKLDNTPTIATFYMDDTSYTTAATGYIEPINDQLRRNTAEGQSNGTTLTTGNSGGGSGDAFSTVSSSGTIGHVYSTDMSMFGAQSYKITASTTSALYCQATVSDVYSSACQTYLYLPAYADNNQMFLSIRNASVSICDININETGVVRVGNAAGTNVVVTGTGVFPTSQWVRVDASVTVGTSTSNGRIAVQLSTQNSFTPFWSYDSDYTTNTGTDSIVNHFFGKLDTVPNIALFYFDDAAWRPKMSAFIPSQSSSPGVGWFVA